MRKPTLTIFYQFNPWHSSIGGIQTLIRSFVKYTPSEFDLRLVGTGVADSKMPVDRWHQAEFSGRELQFFPLFDQPEDNVRKSIPTSLKYTLKLLGRNFSSDFMHFHRLEAAIAALGWRGEKLLYMNNDIHQKISKSSKHKSVLWQRFPWLYFTLEKALIKQFDTVLTCNSDLTQFYKDRYPEISDRVSCVGNSVDDEIFYPLPEIEKENRRLELAQQLALPTDTRFLLFAGRLHPQKDPLLLLQAIAELNNSSAHLLIAGEGELSNAIHQEISRLNLSRRVTLLGAVDQSRLFDLYNTVNALVLSSVYEGLPLVVLEALACGVPIITTRAGGTPNLLTPESGIVCEERTAGEIAIAIDRLMDHPEFYPRDACTQAVNKYRVKNFHQTIFDEMLESWEKNHCKERQ